MITLATVATERTKSPTIFAQVEKYLFKYFSIKYLCAGDKVYDLIGLEAGQAAGAVILLFLLLIAGGLKLYI